MPSTNSIQSLCQHCLCSQHYTIHVILVLQPAKNATNSRGQFEIPLTRQALFLRLSQRTLYNTMAAIFHVMIMWHDNVAQPEIPISRQFLVQRSVAFRSGQRQTHSTYTSTCYRHLHPSTQQENTRRSREWSCNTESAMTSPVWRHWLWRPPYTCIAQFCLHVTLTIFLVMSLL